MALDSFRKELVSASQAIARDIKAQWPEFSLNFIIYQRGQRQDECTRAIATLAGHPAETAVRDLLRSKNMGPENSAFLGIATGTEKGFLGFGKKTSYVGFAAINLDLYTKEEDALFELNHLTAHAIDTFQMIKVKNLNFDNPDIVLQPKRNQLALSRSNLRADIFSALVMRMHGWENAVMDLARNRGMKTLSAQAFYRPEDYPFVIATDVMDYSIKNLLNKKQENLLSLYAMSDKIAASFDKHNLKSWISFSGPAQTMAWNGFTQEQILGTAITTSPDPFIKAMGNLLCEITKITPDTSAAFSNGSNPYVDDQINQINHARLAEETFEIAIIHALEAESHIPFIRMANNQNDSLLKGRMLGWCADALQSAAKTFDQTQKKGLPPAPASRIEFQRLASKPDWQSLDALNQHVVAQRRNGHAMTYGDIAQWCSSRFDMRPVLDSIQLTMGDPEYAQKLAFVSDMPVPGPRPEITSPQPQNSFQMAPGFAPSSGMGMGSGMMGGGIRITPLPQRKTEQDDD